MLTPEQKAIRATGIGASEIAAVVELHPYKEPIDVWMAKPTKTRASLVAEEEDGPTSEVGSALEGGLRALYEKRTLHRLEPYQAITLRHPDCAIVLASPDGLLSDDDAGLEIKIVGSRVAHHWADDSMPDYVRLQAVQNMAVTGRSRWDVIALIGGTDMRVVSVYRDAGLEDTLLAAAREFWDNYIVGDKPPPVRDPRARRRYLRERYPGSAMTSCRNVGDGAEGEIAALVAAYVDAKRDAAEAADAEADLESLLCELVGDDYGVEGRWGKFLWYPRRGAVSWKAVAEELAHGAVPADLIEKHRGAATRTPAFYPPKKRFLR